jgi:signal transduction histidine kinase
MKRDLLEHILHISRNMAETRALTPLLNYVTDEAIKLVGAERGFVVLVQPDGAWDFRVKRGQGGVELKRAGDQVSTSVLNQVIETGEPLVLRDAMNDPHFNVFQSVVALKLQSIMCVPLVSRGETLGAIYVENRSIRNRFSEEDLPPLVLFANQAAVAIENAAINENLEAQVATRTSELEQAKSQIEKSWIEAVEVNRLRTVWLGYLTHDLRTSLGVVFTNLQMFLEGFFGELSQEQLKQVSQALKATEHTVRLVDDLFDLFKLETGSITLYREHVDMQEFLRDVYDVALGLSWPEGVTLKLDASSPLPKLFVDPVRIRQVLLNLLANARKFTSQGSVTLYARFLADRGTVLIGVADTGEGIDASKLERLFERFQQFDDDAQRRRSGTGLGLAICRELVEMHSGRIWVESTPSVGSNFMFVLPLKSPTL